MTTLYSNPAAVILWPFTAIWCLLTFLLTLAGRIVLAAVALVILIFGAVLTVTVAGAVVGVPLLVLGLLLMARSIF